MAHREWAPPHVSCLDPRVQPAGSAQLPVARAWELETVLGDELWDRFEPQLEAVAGGDRGDRVGCHGAGHVDYLFEPMSARVLRDRGALPALDELLARTRDALISELTDTVADGFAASGAAATRLRAVIALALDFWTWYRLTQEGLSDPKAARLMADLTACEAIRPRRN